MERPGTSSLHGEARRTGKRPEPSIRDQRASTVDALSESSGCFALPCEGVSQKGFSAGEGYRPEQVVFVAAPNAFQ